MTRVVALGLRPFAGLLVTTICGAPSNVWVTVTCRRLLLDRVHGTVLTPLLTFIRVNILQTCLSWVEWLSYWAVWSMKLKP